MALPQWRFFNSDTPRHEPAPLPADIGVAAFDALHDDLPAWRGVIEDLAARHGKGPARQMSEGTVLVALLGEEQVLKLYPPFLQDHCDFESTALAGLGGRLSVPTPVLLDSGEHQGWPWLLMTQLAGESLTRSWPDLSEAQKCELLATLGALAAEVHALPVGGLVQKAPLWSDFLARQRSLCHARQQRTGLPAHLLAQLDDFLQGDLPQGPAVILTGEYTPMNLLTQAGRLAGMYDFGDGLVGPREYDWLGPLSFLAAGHAARCRAFFGGYGVQPSASDRLALMRLLLLHRYSKLPLQIAHPGWLDAASFEALAALIWP
jgi:hygromycin-B 7''-O-kinase